MFLSAFYVDYLTTYSWHYQLYILIISRTSLDKVINERYPVNVKKPRASGPLKGREEVERIMATNEMKSAERGKARGAMRTGAIVIGIIAGLAGLLSAVLALMVGGLGAALEAEGASQIIGLGWSALGLSLVGLIGAALIAKPQLAPLIMAAPAVAIVCSISILAVIARPLFLVRRSWAEFGRRPKVRPEPIEAPSGESPVGQ